MRSTKWAGLAVVLLLAAGCAGGWAEPEDTAAVAKPAEPAIDPTINLEEYPVIVDQRDVGPYCLRIRERSEPTPEFPDVRLDRVLEIRKGGESQNKLVVLRREVGYPEGYLQEIDLDGDGVPWLVLQTWSGGVHCCFGYLILELGDPATVVARLNFADYDVFPLNLRLREKDLLVEVPDVTFQQWYSCFAVSRPYPVTVVINPDGLHLDIRSIPPEKPDLEALAAVILDVWNDKDSRSGVDAYLKSAKIATPVELFESMQDLCYKGHGELAWKLLDRVWPANEPGKEEYLALFRKELRTSTFWWDLCALNKWELDVWKEAEN